MKNINEVQTFINNNALGFTIRKNAAKAYVLTNSKGDEITFKTIGEVRDFITSEYTRKKNSGIEGVGKGAESVKIDTSKVLAFIDDFKCPIPTKVKDKVRTENIGEDGVDVNVQLILEKDSEGKLKLPDELSKVISLRNKFNQLVEKYSINISVNGCRLISVHHRNILQDAINEFRDELEVCKSAIVAKLHGWREDAIQSGRCEYVKDKFPSKDYFNRWKLQIAFFPLNEEFDFADEIAPSAIGKIKGELSGFMEGVKAFLHGSKKSFHETGLKKFIEQANILRDGGYITDITATELIEKAIEVSNNFDAVEVRQLKRLIDEGPKFPTGGRGRKGATITKGDIEVAEKSLHSSVEPLNELLAEFEGLV